MYDGKKSTSYDVFMMQLTLFKKEQNKTELKCLKKALVILHLLLRFAVAELAVQHSKIPSEIRPERKTSMGIKWMILYARKRNEKSYEREISG